MNCTDCGELLKEREEKTWCWDCGGHMHAECAMLDTDTADPVCEKCYVIQSRAARLADKTKNSDRLQYELVLRILGEVEDCYTEPEIYTDADDTSLN